MKDVYTSYYIGSCYKSQKNLWVTGQYKFFNLKFHIPVYVGLVSVYIRGYVSSRGDINLCACPSKVSACGNMKSSLSLYIYGGASASLLVRHNCLGYTYVYG